MTLSAGILLSSLLEVKRCTKLSPRTTLTKFSGDQLSPESIVMRLTNAAHYNAAFDVAKSLEVDMTLIFESLTEQCGKLSRSVMADL